MPEVLPEHSSIATNDAPFDQAFAAYHEAEIRPILQTLEEHRLAAIPERERRRLLGIAIILTVGIILFALTVGWNTFGTSAFPFYVFIGALYAVFTWANAPGKSYANEEKSMLIPRIIDFFGDFSYVPEGGVPAENVMKTGIIPLGYEKRLQMTDVITGTRKNVRMCFCHVYSDTGSGKQHRVLFNGQLILAEMPRRRFQGTTILRTRQQGAISNGGRYPGEAALQQVELEDPALSSHFDILSSDQVEARYLLTPDVMERLDTIVQQDETRRLQCSFIDSTLCISIDAAPNMFVPSGLDRSAYDTHDIEGFLERTSLAIALVDALDG
jgi:hypothetical protein